MRKRLTVVNDGWTRLKKPAQQRIRAVIARYLCKMRKSWGVEKIYTGDAMTRYEAIIIMYKKESK